MADCRCLIPLVKEAKESLFFVLILGAKNPTENPSTPAKHIVIIFFKLILSILLNDHRMHAEPPHVISVSGIPNVELVTELLLSEQAYPAINARANTPTIIHK
jgi:hypothetical protein